VEIHLILLILLLLLLGLLSVTFYRYVRRTKEQIAKQQEIINATSASQNRLYTILGQEVRKPILTFRGISKKIDFLITHKEFDTLKKLGNQLDENATDLNLVLENLLIWAQTHKKDYSYQPQSIPVKQILEELTHTFFDIIQKKEIPFTTSFDEAAHLNADLNSLMLLLKKILSQIIYHSSCETPLDIKIATSSNSIIFTVSSAAIPTDFLENTEKNAVENFTPHFLKELILLNRGTIQKLIPASQNIPTLQISFPRG